MLDPLRDRAVLLDLLRPPSGCRIERIIGTTYTLDLEALIAVCLAMTDLPWDEDDNRKDRLAPLVAVRRAVSSATKDRPGAPAVMLACHASAIHLPHGIPALAPWLERIVIPVLPQAKDGIFHPKAWLVRWRDPDNQIGWHAVIGSRNCTGDQRWDAGLRLVSRPNGHRRRESRGLSALVRALPNLAQRAGATLDEACIRALKRDADELEQFTFHLPEDDAAVPINVHGLGTDETGTDALEELRDKPVTRLLIVSPFVDKGFLSRIRTRHSGAPLMLVSTSITLDQCAPFTNGIEARELRGSGLIDASATVLGDGIAIPPKGEGLHAKLFFFEYGKYVRVIVGSPNATIAAWGDGLKGNGPNVELSVVLDGPKSRFGIEATLRQWQDILVPHLTQAVPAESKFERQLEDRLRESMAAIQAAGPSVTWVLEEAGWTAILSLAQPLARRERVSITLKPLTSEADHAREIGPGISELRWHKATLPQVTAWFVVRLKTQLNEQSLTWERVLLLPMTGAPIAERDSAVLQSLVSSGASLLRFLCLTARADGAMTGTGRRGRNKTGDDEDADLTLEDLLRAAADADVIRFRELDSVIRQAASLGESSALPPNFNVVWNTLREAKGSARV